VHFRRGSRLAVAFIAVATGTMAATLFGAPAWAHVTVDADNPEAGARNVTVTFVGEAESSKAGIASEQVFLPAGIRPQDVRLVKAPAGWTLTATADGYTVAGKALPVGENATYSVIIAQLPANATELAFKTLETYGDGSISRWIEIPVAGPAVPDNPAPVLKLKPAAAPAASTAPTPTTLAETATAEPLTSPAAAATGDSATGWWIAAAVVAVLAAIGAALMLARRRRQVPPGSP
jgi:LPXTG-motif cell wall-anchored protein